MAIYARNRPTREQVERRDHNRAAIERVRRHNETQSRRLEDHNRTVVAESLKDPGVRKRLGDQLDGHASRGSDDDCVQSWIRSVGADNLRFKP